MKTTNRNLWSLMVMVLVLCSVSLADVQLPSVIADNMVLQQKSKVAIWGWAEPGEKITVKGSWGGLFNFAKKTKADKDGKWKVSLKTSKAGGPYTVSIKGNNEITLKNVLVGEVWVCSGQSNMEWPTIQVNNSEAEIAAADYPNIRLFMVEKATAVTPQTNCSGSWKLCTPETAAPFSAIGYFFARELNKELNIPIGMIGTYWGGTVAEAWTSEPTLRKFGEFDEALKKVDEEKALIPPPNPKFWKTRHDWNQEILKADPGTKDKWFQQNLDDSGWKQMSIPVLWERTDLGELDGIVWFRKHIEIPADWAGKELTVELGPIDDTDITWFNGTQIGQTNYYQDNRNYTISAGLVKTGTNVLAVKVLDTGGGGGLWGTPDQLKIYPKDQADKALSLAGNWKYKVAVTYMDLPGYRSFMPVGPNTPTALYNAMIAPLIPYGIKGALWYQGESNCGRAEQYSRLFPAMIRNWRDDWGCGDFPFYYAQIAPYHYDNPDDPMSAFLREAQMKTLSFKNTGMAVTMDIGNVNDIHPRNKQDVGLRLALWALVKDYGRKNIIYSGPIYKSMKIEGDKIRLFFDYTGSGLMAKDGPLTCFTIAGKDGKFEPAKAVIDSATIVVSSDSVKDPVAVRYAFTNASQPNLFNKEGLPASSFRTDNWQPK